VPHECAACRFKDIVDTEEHNVPTAKSTTAIVRVVVEGNVDREGTRQHYPLAARGGYSHSSIAQTASEG